MIATKARIAGCAAAALVAVAGSLGLAVTNRGPDPAVAPLMAERPFIMPDGRELHVQKYEITVAEWARCHRAGACSLEVKARPGTDAASLPATGLSYIDVNEFISWIREETDHAFRLPTLAEWKAFAREVLPGAPDPVFADPALGWASSYLTENLPGRSLEPQGSFSVTSLGIADLDGSVWEWTQDCHRGRSAERCVAFFVGGEHIAVIPYLVRDPARGGCAVGSPPAHLGLRLVADRPFRAN